VVALLGLIGLTLVIFAVLGMNLFGGKLEAEWDLELVELGASVYVSVPLRRLHPNGSAYIERVRRHGLVTARVSSSRGDAEGLPLWRVQDEWGATEPNALAVNASLAGALDASGTNHLGPQICWVEHMWR